MPFSGQHVASNPPKFKLPHAIVAVGLLVTTTVVGLFGLDLYRSYQAEIDDAKRSTQGYAQVLAEHTARSFEAIDRTLQEAEAIRRETGTGRYSTIDQANVALRHLRQSSPLIVAVGWTDVHGNVIAHSYDRKPPRPNISELPHFKLQRDGANPESGPLVLSPPFRAVATGGWITAASRRLTNGDGSFAGVVTAPLEQSYFQQTWRCDCSRLSARPTKSKVRRSKSVPASALRSRRMTASTGLSC